jgi:4-amino-4-deoxy-L-arabinose transferase-like glycosyltransferase
VKDLVLLLLLLAAATANGLLWMLSIPFQKGPDEAAHFQVIRFILDYGRLPMFRPEELWLIRVPVGVVETYAAFPPLAYLLAAVARVPFRESTMWIARLGSAAAYVGTVGFAFLTARQLFPHDRQVALVTGMVVAFLPQFAFTSAYVNNDALAALESAAVAWLLSSLRWERPPARQLLALGVLAGALMITKYTVYPVALIAVVAPLVPVLRCPPELIRRGALIGLAAAGTAGWWFARNWTLYRELIPSQVVAEAKARAGGNTLFVPDDHGLNLLTISTHTDFWTVTLQSFVGVFGYLDLFLDPWLYRLSAALAILGAIGLLVRLRRGPIRRELWGAAGIGVTLLFLTVASALAISTYGEYSPQGRYLFGALVPIVVALAAGWTWLGRLHPALRVVPFAAVGSALGLNAASLVAYVVPTHFGPASESILVQVDHPSTLRPRGTSIEVMGWSLAQGGHSWRPFAPGVVADYRRPVNGVMIYLDGPPGVGRFQGAARYGFRRLDVSDMYGRARPIERTGFRLVLPPGAVSPGKHRIYACATVPSRASPVCTNREFEVG